MTHSRAAVVAALLIASPRVVTAQAAQAELSLTGGASTQSVNAAASQLRVFGEPKRNLRFFLEGAWATQTGTASDAFGGAYPYNGRIQAIETYGEVFASRETLMLSVRGGRYRTPFGIYGRGEHGYGGFTRPPMVRYDDYWGLSNNFLDGGVNVVAGHPRVHAEVSLGVPQDVGVSVRRSGFAPVMRVEGYAGGLVVGASRIQSKPYMRRARADDTLAFTGVDLRYMVAGVQLRGEYITGKPMNNAKTTGWYLDAIVHRPELGPVTLLARAEGLDYIAPTRRRFPKRVTTGARIQLPAALVAQVNVVHQPGGLFDDPQKTAMDVALTWVLRVGR